MNGPLYLLILVGVIFLLWLYPGPAKKALAGVGKVNNELKKNGAASFKGVVMILLSVAVLWWFYSSSWKTPSLATVVEWKSTYWLPILVGLGIVYAFAGYAKTVIAEAQTKAVATVFMHFVEAAAFMLFIGFPVWVRVTGPNTAAASNEWVLTMPPGGETEHIPATSKKFIVMRGKDFRYHCKYADGHEESFGRGDQPACEDGDVLYAWASNLRKEESNAITYFYR